MKQMMVHYEARSCELALLEDGKLVEYAVERADGRESVGSLYKGKVVNVIPGMQAAFVDIGQKKNAFLYIDDVLSPHLEKQPRKKPSISELLEPGQELVVQVIKEAIGTKGARITTHYSFPGRFIVYMPTAGYVAISKKIEVEAERSRLKAIGDEECQGDEGLIFRTNAENEDREILTQDLAMLRRQWTSALAKAETAFAPELLHSDLSMVQRLMRDVFSPQTDELLMDNERQAEEAEVFLEHFSPDNKPKIRVHRSDTPLFEAYGIKYQLEKSFQRKVWLPGGGYLIWDQTEAMNVVDVNTGKYIGTDSLEDTVFQTNLEAAEEIARLLRLRDVGGIIIIDFIDMEQEEHRHQVLTKLQEGMREDRTQYHILGWTKLGLLEMTRKKIRETKNKLIY